MIIDEPLGACSAMDYEAKIARLQNKLDRIPDVVYSLSYEIYGRCSASILKRDVVEYINKEAM